MTPPGVTERPPKPPAGANALRRAFDLVEEHGDEAEIMAALKADELFEAGDQATLAEWMEVLYALDEIRRIVRRPGELPN